MLNPLTPGVYIEEKPGPKPIQAVGTATAGFIGIAEKGPIGTPVLITNWTQFVNNFGNYIPNSYLAYCVNQFFKEGGSKCYVVRTCHYTDVTDPSSITAKRSSNTFLDRAASPVETLYISALTEGNIGDNISIEIDDGEKTDTFKLTVRFMKEDVEVYDNLDMGNVEAAINDSSQYIRVDSSPPPSNVPSGTEESSNQPALTVVTLDDTSSNPNPTLKVSALTQGLSITIEHPNSDELTLIINRFTNEVEKYSNLTMNKVEKKINGISKYIKVKKLDNNSTDNRPAITTNLDLNFFRLIGGWDGLFGVVLQDALNDTLEVSAFTDGVTIDIVPSTSDNTFKIIVYVDSVKVEEFSGLIMADVENRINWISEYILVNNMESGTPDNRPAETAVPLEVPLSLTDTDFTGDEGAKTGLYAFNAIEDVNILAIPDRSGDREVILEAYTYCGNRKDCFFIADPPLGLSQMDMLAFKKATEPFSGNAFNSSYAALYYPWVKVQDPLTNKLKLVPPSGAIAGSYSSTDTLKGVHKSPAGTTDGYLNSVMDIETIVTAGEQEILNPNGINVIRSFPNAGIVIWGARTLSADPEWKYVCVRRLLMMIENSIKLSTQWVVFEPNNRSLWQTIKRDVSAFLTTVWRSGALFGASEDEAFFVKVDNENNPPEIRDAGKLIIDIGVAPVKPAEFVIFRISQKTLES